MNRLRETTPLPSTERWILAATYKLAGLGDLAGSLVAGTRPDTADGIRGTAQDDTFRSELRDRAMILQSLIALGRLDESADLVKAIAAELASQNWYSTQSVAYSLMAMARVAGAGSPEAFTFEHNFGVSATTVASHTPVYQTKMNKVPAGGRAVFIHNTSPRTLFVTIATRGVMMAGEEDSASAGLALQVSYTDEQGNAVSASRLTQGTDFVAHVEVTNLTSLRIDNIALTEIFPAGWEIHNDRMDNAGAGGMRMDRERAPYGWMVPDGSRDATQASVDYTDIRDDRVLQYFGLRAGETIRFEARLNAAYRGRYYLPSVQAEAMYDATKTARVIGQWTEVVAASR
jgi:alpha-2-macroglobulin